MGALQLQGDQLVCVQGDYQVARVAFERALDQEDLARRQSSEGPDTRQLLPERKGDEP